jgi:hypothetical protein
MTQHISSPATAIDNREVAPERRSNDERPSNHEVENENLRSPVPDGTAPRPATEPPGAKGSVNASEILTDPGSGEN